MRKKERKKERKGSKQQAHSSGQQRHMCHIQYFDNNNNNPNNPVVMPAARIILLPHICTPKFHIVHTRTNITHTKHHQTERDQCNHSGVHPSIHSHIPILRAPSISVPCLQCPSRTPSMPLKAVQGNFCKKKAHTICCTTLGHNSLHHMFIRHCWHNLLFLSLL